MCVCMCARYLQYASLVARNNETLHLSLSLDICMICMCVYIYRRDSATSIHYSSGFIGRPFRRGRFRTSALSSYPSVPLTADKKHRIFLARNVIVIAGECIGEIVIGGNV